MNSRVSDRPETEREPFGLVAWLQDTRVALPLKGVECRFSVCGELVHVELDQIFHQNATRPVDCLYTFPLPYGAVVYRCEMHVNGRMVRAKVEEVEEARRLVQQHKAAGHRTALVEMERENLFTLSLGNLQPNDVVVVRFGYFQTLDRLEDWASFHIPVCPGIRYIPGRPLLRSPRGAGVEDDTDQVPDASRISPPRIDALHPDAAYFVVEGTVQDPLDRLQDIASPSHGVLVQDEPHLKVLHLAEDGAVPDRDFVLRWTEKPSPDMAATGWVCQTDAQTSHALIRLVGPANASPQQATGQDVYFLVDRSGSMEGIKWRQAARGFVEFLKAVGPKDRVWATFFDSDFQDLAEKPLPASQSLKDPATRNIDRFYTGGGTEILPALQHVLEKVPVHSKDRPASLVIITDGEIGKEAEVIAELDKHPQLQVHILGVDTVPNDALLKPLAERHQGQCYLLTPNDDIVGTVARLARCVGQPVLTGLSVDPAWQLPNDILPVLYANGVESIPLEGPAGATQVTVQGQRPDGSTYTLQVQLQPVTEPALRLLWTRKRIQHLERIGDRAEALRLAKETNLICQGAAFVAWDDVENVAVSAQGDEIYQPSMMPHAWEMVDLLQRARPRPATGVLECFCPMALRFPGLYPAPESLASEVLECLNRGDYRQQPIPAQWTRALRLLEVQGRRRVNLDPVELDQLLRTWRRAMDSLGLFNAAWAQLIDCLVQWVQEKPERAALRLALLLRLLANLAAPDLDMAACVRLVEQWVKRNLTTAANLRTRAERACSLLIGSVGA